MGKLLKPVSFNEEKEKEMLEYIDALGVPFASYVKRLIQQDMEKATQESEISELVTVLKDMMKNNMMMPQMGMMMPQMGMMMPQMGMVAPQQQMVQQQPQGSSADEEDVVIPSKKDTTLSDKQSKSLDNLMNKFSIKK